MSFVGRTAVVTGAAGGMGSVIACDLLAQGARVALFDLEDARNVVPQSAAPDAARCFNGDLADVSFVEQAVGDVHAWTGRIDYLVNVAGRLDFDTDRSLIDIDLGAWQRSLDANLSSMVHMSRHAAPFMIATGGGAMVHFSSTQALRGDDRPQDAYQAAKAAIISLSKSLAIQLAPHGIRSNTVIPGPTESPMQARWAQRPEMRAATEKVVPLGRVGTTQDMANAALFLLSDQAAYITGTELIVDGGLLARP